MNKGLYLSEIQELTSKGQQLKRNGKIDEAVNLLENGLKYYKNIKDVHNEGIASIKKSLAKLYYLKKNIKQSAILYIEAIEIYNNSGNDHQVSVCLFHLGCCSDTFLKSRLFFDYVFGLSSGDSVPPGHPDSLFSENDVRDLSELGLRIFNQYRDEQAKKRVVIDQPIDNSKQFIIKDIGDLIDDGGDDPTIVRIKKSTDFQDGRRKNAILELAFWDFEYLKELEAFFTLSYCNILDEFGDPYFNDGGGLADPDQFNVFWRMLPAVTKDEIHSYILDVNPHWISDWKVIEEIREAYGPLFMRIQQICGLALKLNPDKFFGIEFSTTIGSETETFEWSSENSKRLNDNILGLSR